MEKISLQHETVLKCRNVFQTLSHWADIDKSIRLVFDQHPKNKKLSRVLAKVAMINTFYATQILDVAAMANHITRVKNLDKLLKDGDPGAVDQIRRGHAICAKNGNEIDLYSFAAKYCSFQNPKDYPIYDDAIASVLIKENARNGWTEKLSRRQLKDYTAYLALVDRCLQACGVSDLGYKEADKGLWVFAKYNAAKNKSDLQRNKHDIALINAVEATEEKPEVT
jgi:hypothetical protein